jgi:hypothetical protein
MTTQTPKMMEVFVVVHDVKGTATTIRTTPVSRKYWDEGSPDRDCLVSTALIDLKAAEKIAEWYEAHRPRL